MKKRNNLIRKSQLQNSALFCGAGISKGSGLPLADDLKRYILEKLFSDAAAVQQIMSTDLPFELFLETILEDHDAYLRLLNLFERGEPNATHSFVAKLVKLGLVKNVYTTNFDLLLETAFSRQGLVEGEHYVRFYNKEHFEMLDHKTITEALGDKAGLFKIHGSADEPASVTTLLTLVASKILSVSRSQVIEDAFSRGSHDRTIVVGYSCSDVFDITLMIERITGNISKPVLFIEHIDYADANDLPRAEPVQVKELKNPFKHFLGDRIYCNTDFLIKNTWNNLEGTFGEYCQVEPCFDWQPFVDNWFEDFTQNKARTAFVAGKLFACTSCFDEAIQYFFTALENTKESDNVMRFKCCVALGSAYKQQGHPREAICHYEQALQIASEPETVPKIRKSDCYVGLADCYELIGENTTALELFANASESAQQLKDFNDFQVMARACGGVGRILCGQGYYEEAIPFHKNALDLAQNLGDISWEALCYVHLGTICRFSNEPAEAIELYTKALRLAELSSDKAIEAGCYANLALVNLVSKQWLKAERCVEKALSIAISTGDQTVEPLSYSTLANIFLSRWDFIRAANTFHRALMLAQAVDYAIVCLGSYMGLFQAYSYLGAFELALECSQQAAKYAQRVGNKKAEASCYGCMGIFFERLQKKDEATKSFLKQKGCLEEASESHPSVEQIQRIRALIPTKTQG